MYPSVTIELLVERSTALKEMLESDELDLIIDNSVTRISDMSYTPLFEERILIGIPSDLEINEHIKECLIPDVGDIRDAKKVDMKLLSEEDFILLKDGNSMREIAVDIFDESGISPRVSVELDTLLSAVRYAECGFGICLLTDTVLKSRKTELSLYVPDTRFASRVVYIIKKEKRYTSVSAREFMRLLECEIKESF